MTDDSWRLLRITAAAALIAASAVYSFLQEQKQHTVELKTICIAEETDIAAQRIVTETVPQETAEQTETHCTETAPPEQTAVRTDAEIRTPDTNLNTAEASDLMRVPGVGSVLADAVLSYRAAVGGFTRRSQLLEIDGIGAVLAERIMAEFYIPDELPPEVHTVKPETVPVQTAAAEPVQPEIPAEGYDLNAVTREELLRLPGMTETAADSILAVRAEIGRFSSVYELVLSEEISDLYFTQVLRNYLHVADDPAVQTQETAQYAPQYAP